jgi:hypothetical protein
LDRSGAGVQFGPYHRPAPAIGESAAHPLLDEIAVVGVDAHVGPVHDFDDLTIDAARHDA